MLNSYKKKSVLIKDKITAVLNSFLVSLICLRKKNGVMNLIKGAIANIMPTCVALYPMSNTTLGIYIIYAPTAPK
jgi:hypothetical protein